MCVCLRLGGGNGGNGNNGTTGGTSKTYYVSVQISNNHNTGIDIRYQEDLQEVTRKIEKGGIQLIDFVINTAMVPRDVSFYAVESNTFNVVYLNDKASFEVRPSEVRNTITLTAGGDSIGKCFCVVFCEFAIIFVSGIRSPYT